MLPVEKGIQGLSSSRAYFPRKSNSKKVSDTSPSRRNLPCTRSSHIYVGLSCYLSALWLQVKTSVSIELNGDGNQDLPVFLSPYHRSYKAAVLSEVCRLQQSSKKYLALVYYKDSGSPDFAPAYLLAATFAQCNK